MLKFSAEDWDCGGVRCDVCFFSTFQDTHEGTPEWEWLCRRYPPAVTPDGPHWPMVRGDQWCGEFVSVSVLGEGVTWEPK